MESSSSYLGSSEAYRSSTSTFTKAENIGKKWDKVIQLENTLERKTVIWIKENVLGANLKEKLMDQVSESRCESDLDDSIDESVKKSATRGRQTSLSVDWDNIVRSTKQSKHFHISQIEDKDVIHKHPGYVETKHKPHKFCTSSVYTGNWNFVGMFGQGNYTFDHGVQYVGNLKDGMFDGKGTLTYPMGQKLEGVWNKGQLISFKYAFADGLGCEKPWKYCQMPDRRYFTSIRQNLRPAGRSLTTNEHPPRKIPDGCYDTGDGFYNPATKCVTSAIEPGKIIRIPTRAQEAWIKENCRKAWDEPVGYKPNLYERWVSGRDTDSVFNEPESISCSYDTSCSIEK